MKSNSKKKKTSQSKSDFVALVAHQLRAPSLAVKWHAEMLGDEKHGALNQKQKEYLLEIQHGAEKMIKLVNNLLSIGRIETGKLKVVAKPLDLKELLAQAIKEQEPQITIKNHTVVVSQSGEIPKISSDPVLLAIILQNIVSNAVKYTPDHGNITCTISVGSQKVLVKVADNGIGIPPKEQKNIFEKLFRASNANAHDSEGNGLGLYINKEIIKLLGGKIWFESEVKKGTAFYVALPLKI